MHYADGYWVAYFEGLVSTSCTWSTVETVEALATELQEQLANGLSLKALCYGEGVWFLYFDGAVQGDADWVIEPKFDSFVAKLQVHYDNMRALQCVAYGDRTWVGFWEGKTPETLPSAWGARSKVLDFVTHVKVGGANFGFGR